MQTYYIAKLKYQVPKEETDEMKKESKSYLIQGLSITEVEARLTEWIPSNFQDPEITSIQEAKYIDLITDEDSENFWEVKLGDENEKGKLVPFLIVIDGDHHMEVLKRVEKKYNTSEFIAIKKLNVIIDSDLTSDPLTGSKISVTKVTANDLDEN